jgi:hypothetical protein
MPKHLSIRSWLDIETKRGLEGDGAFYPPEVADYIESGGVDLRVADAIEEAAARARRECLDDLERMRDELPDNADVMARAYLEAEIARLQRRMTPTPERKRTQTRERVRRYREKQREGNPT